MLEIKEQSLIGKDSGQKYQVILDGNQGKDIVGFIISLTSFITGENKN